MTSSVDQLVSYVVLSYNHASYISAAIDSIINQDYPHIELVVIDDGSNDGSVVLLRELQRKYGFKLILQENTGVVAALNRGICETTGSYIIPHASDDVSHPNRTREQLAHFLTDSSVGLVVGGIRKISEVGSVIEDWKPGSRIVYSFDDFVSDRAHLPAVSCMYNGTVIRQVLPLDESLSFEDVQLFWRVSELGYTCLFDQTILSVDYRIVLGSLGRSNKIRHHYSFLKFLQTYRDRPWYRSAIKRTNSRIFSLLAESSKYAAISFFVSNLRNISLSEAMRGWIKVMLPRRLVAQLKKRA